MTRVSTVRHQIINHAAMSRQYHYGNNSAIINFHVHLINFNLFYQDPRTKVTSIIANCVVCTVFRFRYHSIFVFICFVYHIVSSSISPTTVSSMFVLITLSSSITLILNHRCPFRWHHCQSTLEIIMLPVLKIG